MAVAVMCAYAYIRKQMQSELCPMQTISVRVPDDDLEWLLGLDAAGARSPSDRIRSLIAASRRQSEGMADYVACVAMLRDFLRPFENMLHAVERRHGIHSEVVGAIEQS